VYTELGDVLREQGKLDESLKSYMKALIEHVGDKKAHAGAAQVYELQNNKRQGHRRVVDLHPHGLLLGVLEQGRQAAHRGPAGRARGPGPLSAAADAWARRAQARGSSMIAACSSPSAARSASASTGRSGTASAQASTDTQSTST
jgi:hypothetical protein